MWLVTNINCILDNFARVAAAEEDKIIIFVAVSMIAAWRSDHDLPTCGFDECQPGRLVKTLLNSLTACVFA